MTKRTRVFVIVVATTAWGINFLCTLLVDGYHPAESINGVFAAVIGGAVAVSRGGEEDE